MRFIGMNADFVRFPTYGSVADKTAVGSLLHADTVVVDTVGIGKIFRIAGRLPELHSHYVGVNHRTGFCPGVETVKPVIVFEILRHSTLLI